MTKSKIEDRPLRSKAEIEREKALTARYGALGNAELAAALRLQRAVSGADQQQSADPFRFQQE